MKRREMRWDVRATGVKQLAAQHFYFFWITIFTQNQKRRQFHPARCFLHHIGYCFQNRLNLGSGKLFIKALGKSLEINIWSIHRAKKLFARRITNIACGNRNILDVLRTTSGGKVEGLCQKNNGIIIGIGDRPTAILSGNIGVSLRAGMMHQGILITTF
jgi:hypothetical protein